MIRCSRLAFCYSLASYLLINYPLITRQRQRPRRCVYISVFENSCQHDIGCLYALLTRLIFVLWMSCNVRYFRFFFIPSSVAGSLYVHCGFHTLQPLNLENQRDEHKTFIFLQIPIISVLLPVGVPFFNSTTCQLHLFYMRFSVSKLLHSFLR